MPASSCIVGSCSRTTLESSQRCHSNHIVNAAPDESDLAPTCEHGMNVGIPSSSSEIKKNYGACPPFGCYVSPTSHHWRLPIGGLATVFPRPENCGYFFNKLV